MRSTNYLWLVESLGILLTAVISTETFADTGCPNAPNSAQIHVYQEACTKDADAKGFTTKNGKELERRSFRTECIKRLTELADPKMAVKETIRPNNIVKRDIRGAEIGMRRDEIESAMRSTGAKCVPGDNPLEIDCVLYEGSEKNNIEIDFGLDGKAWKIDYTFFFHTSPYEVMAKIQNQFGLSCPHNVGQNNLGTTITSYYFYDDVKAFFQYVGNRASFIISDEKLQLKQSTMPKF